MKAAKAGPAHYRDEMDENVSVYSEKKTAENKDDENKDDEGAAQ